LAQHHDRGEPGRVGAHLQYLVYSAGGDPLSAVGWQSAVERLDCRDRLAGVRGQPALRAQFLARAVNHVRLLILPTVRVAHLASVISSEGVRVLQRDWPPHYGRPVWWGETFVDRARCRGPCYRAAHWLPIGWTRGYAKAHGEFVYHGQPKAVYAYVIEPRLRRRLLADPNQPLLTRNFLLAQRLREQNQPLARRKTMSVMDESWAPKLPPHWALDADDLKHVGQELQEFTAQVAETFRRIEPAQLCRRYLQGLLSDTARKNVEAIALALAGPEAVRNLQRFVTDYQWDEP
jgi:hypothetical protein